MSEEILKALTQLFALIAKQDAGIAVAERSYVESFFKSTLDFNLIEEYMNLFNQHLIGKKKRRSYREKERNNESIEKKQSLVQNTRVNESVRILGICKKINKTLSRKQKIVVLFRILELISQENNASDSIKNKMEIVETVGAVFKFDTNEYEQIRKFVFSKSVDDISRGKFLIANNKANSTADVHHISLKLNGEIIFIFVESVEMYFTKYIGEDEINMNGFIMKPNHTYTFSPGSIIKIPNGDVLFFSDLSRYFYEDYEKVKLSFNANGIYYKFPGGNIGLRDIVISEGPGQLIGVMGSSGAGKTTLLNCLAGLVKPSSGTIKINGIDIFNNKEDVEGLIGYVSQDDLLIGDLTVYENLSYNAKLCFGDLSEEEIDKRVIKILVALGLEHRKDLKVGSPLEKTISGGQRKRLNIALELIREPAVMFVDEPTSGLSSRDSENVIDLLKELTLKGKLIFVVIHQPSSDIYKMFDKMVILDTGGYQIFYGNPVSAITWFKQAANQIGGEKGNCTVCGNVNPEQIFNIIEAQVVDEYGQYTGKRKTNPQDWTIVFQKKSSIDLIETVNEKPTVDLRIPSLLKQWNVFVKRDVVSKLRNKQYVLINLLEAPVLALVLAFLIRYKNFDDGISYSYRFNDNIPAFFLMSIIVALFIGLSVSAEEIIKDRIILKREKFLNLSWGSYLFSKIFILFITSAIQMLVFVFIGHFILEIESQFFLTFFILFSTSCFANVLGLNVSSMMKSAVNVYILIPILLIPQMVLSGLLFKFSQLNDYISSKEKVPIVADLMVSRWAYEAIAVGHFMNNPYKSPFYEYEKREKKSSFFTSYLTKEIKKDIDYLHNNPSEINELKYVNSRNRTIHSLSNQSANVPFPIPNFLNNLEQNKLVDDAYYVALINYLNKCKEYHFAYFNTVSDLKSKERIRLENEVGYDAIKLKNIYHNERLKELVRNLTTDTRLIKTKNKYYQNIESIFTEPEKPKNPLNYRTHFFAPMKWFFGCEISTIYFNMLVIWMMILTLILFLYIKLFEKFTKFN